MDHVNLIFIYNFKIYILGGSKDTQQPEINKDSNITIIENKYYDIRRRI